MISLLLLLLLGICLFGYTYFHMDYAADEALFALAHGSHTTRLYYSDPAQKVTADGRPSQLPAGYCPVEREGQRIHGTQNSIYCAYRDIPQAMKDAFVAIEDKRFYQHHGIDLLRTAKAAANYVLKFDGRFGGSTITQQLIKNISADDEITPARKMREVCRALHLENMHSKEEILELYLNIVPLSQGCMGVGAAAEKYYGKNVSELTVAECASIAAITNSPARYDPYKSKENNRARRDLILHEMRACEMLTQEAYEAALAEEMHLVPLAGQEEVVYDWYTETVLSDVTRDLVQKKGLAREAAEQLVYNGGLQIYTQMDAAVQGILEQYFSDLRHFPTACQNGLSYAMTVCDPYSGDLLGIVSAVGKKTKNRVFNHAADATRAPGSALKPLSVYAPALEEGVIRWSSVLDDVPLRFEKSQTGYTPWPGNSPAVYNGLTDVQDAVAYSKNTVAVQVLKKLGKERSYAYLTEKLGLSTLVREERRAGGILTDLAEAPLALGQLSHGVTLRALTNAYGALADGGVYHPSRSYSLVLDGNGKVLLQNDEAGERVFSRESACIMTKLLQGVTSYGTAKSITLDRLVEAAGKTGTSGENRDKWFVGYTPYYTAGVWCGYEDGTTAIPAELAGVHVEVWDAIMHRLHSRLLATSHSARKFEIPLRVVRREYCKDSGMLPCENCRLDVRNNRICLGYFLADDVPKETCDRHIAVLYDKVGGGVACAHCPRSQVETVGMLLLPQRSFPTQVYVADAQYGYRALAEEEITRAPDRPFYEGLIPAGQYIGLTRTESGRQFNAACSLHDGRDTENMHGGGGGNGFFDWWRKYFALLDREE